MFASSTSSSTKKACSLWKLLTLFSSVAALALAVILVIVALKNEKLHETVKNLRKQEEQVQLCPSGDENIDLSEPDTPTVFTDLTKKEMNALSDYLHNQRDINLVRVAEAEVNSSYLYMVELLLPNKADVLHHLDDAGVQPTRWAKAVIFRGDLLTPQVEEYRVGPLPKPNVHTLIDYGQRRKNPVPFAYRPLTFTEFVALGKYALADIERIAGKVILESYGASFANCGQTCLSFIPTPVSTSAYGRITRNMWIRLTHNVEFASLHPLDFQILVNLDGSDYSQYTITNVWYNQQNFNSLEELAAAYDNGTVNKLEIPFPTTDGNLFSTLNRRGKAFPRDNMRRPQQVEPDGKRYTIRNQFIEYLGWKFDYRMSSSLGPMLFNVRYNGERIAYEISLQQIAVFYSANNPATRFADYMDGAMLLGTLSKTLIPGADCPEHATFLPAHHLTEMSDRPFVYENALCVFEQDTGIPMRRHHSPGIYGNVYGGMMDDVLVLRTILTASNYDYIFDFVLHQNGAIEVRVISTGYILASYFADAEQHYGFRIHKNILGTVHHHMFSFKVDLDILGTSNRFESLDIGTEHLDNYMWIENPEGSTSSQMTVDRNLKKTESEAGYKFNFEKPKYLLFHNDQARTQYDVPRSYRVAIHGMSKQMLPENGTQLSIPWSRFQMAVTKYHDNEMESSSIYAIWDATDPVRNFQSYLDDNETLVDQDLVTWITLGAHHIPHTEDLPVTPTVGGHLQFFLLPYNYFPEDPSIASSNAIRVDIEQPSSPDIPPKIKIHRYGHDVGTDDQCLARPSNFATRLEKNKHLVF